jgi:hypothetical protein
MVNSGLLKTQQEYVLDKAIATGNYLITKYEI